MRTDDLICMMAKAPPCSCAKRNAVIWGAVLALFAAMVGVIHFAMGIRGDFYLLAERYDTLFKYAFLSAVAVGSGLAWWQSGHPGKCFRVPQYGLLALAVILLALDVAVIIQTPPAEAVEAVMDKAAYGCVAFIVLFSIAGSAALTALTQCMAPTSCRRHAFLTALFATALGALAYAFHCQNDSPLYLALWYGGAGAVVTLASMRVLMKRQAW